MDDDLDRASDALLMGYIADGRGEAIAPLIRRYHRALLAFLRRATAGAAEAEDLFQDTWIRVVRSARTYDPTYAFSTWLFRIAWNRVRDYWARLPAVPRSQQVPLESHPSEAPGADEMLLARERAGIVSSLVRELPPRLAEAVWLRYFEDLNEKQMAVRLQVPPGTVKSRLHHGLKLLGALLQERSLA